MPSNVEIKAKVHDVTLLHTKAAEISESTGTLITQEDTFFNTTQGRLKLRELKNRSELIYYDRPDEDGPKLSEYCKTDVENPADLKKCLKMAYGIKGVVKKTRMLYMVDQTRVHVDDVDGLGKYMELEVQMKEGQSLESGQKIADDLMEKLGVKSEDLITGAYMDLILKQSDDVSPTKKAKLDD